MPLRRFDMSADGRAQRHEERQQRQSFLLAFVARVEIAVQRKIGEARSAHPPEIHEQEGQVVKDVDGRNVVGEFDAVEGCRFALKEADIAKVQIAVAGPHLALRPPRVEKSPLRVEGSV